MASLQNKSDPQSQSDMQQTTELPPGDNHTKALPNSSLPAPKHPFIHETHSWVTLSLLRTEMPPYKS